MRSLTKAVAAAAALAMGCGASAPASQPSPGPSASSVAPPDATVSPGPSPGPLATSTARPPNGRVVTGGPVVLPDGWARCEKDADCTFVALGCCDITPVARARAAEAQRKLEASGRPYCAPKAACGPGPDGTFAGTAGRCTKGACGCDPAAPLYKNCLGE